ncbi:MAG: hypothetical protein HQL26_10430 [Candidatus Omnitrophica bacterium]|nr:hypothetical protein [Candidatus Omnitrophota bacterium]
MNKDTEQFGLPERDDSRLLPTEELKDVSFTPDELELPEFTEADVSRLNLDNDLSAENFDHTAFLASESTPIISRFNRFMKVTAVSVLLAFLPQQISWAFNYNPAIIWHNMAPVTAPMSMPLMDETLPGTTKNQALASDELQKSEYGKQVAQYVSTGMGYLLNQLVDKKDTRVRLQLPASHKTAKKESFVQIDLVEPVTRPAVDNFVNWLKKPEIHALNCGVYALQDILKDSGVNLNPEELSVSSLSVDILYHIIKPADPRLKTSLFAIDKIARGYGLDYVPVKLDKKEDVINVQTPFIAHFSNEHFVTVTSINKDKVEYLDIGRKTSADTVNFIGELSGFLYTKSTAISGIHATKISESLSSYVWGSKWRDKSKELPGFLSNSSLFKDWLMGLVQVIITVILFFIPAIGWAAIVGYIVSQIVSTLFQICVAEGACNAKTAMILSIAISAAITAGIAYATAPAAALTSPSTLDPAGELSQTTSQTAQTATTGALVGAGTAAATATTTSVITTVFQGFVNILTKLVTFLADITGLTQMIQVLQNLVMKIWELIKDVINFIAGDAPAAPAQNAAGTGTELANSVDSTLDPGGEMGSVPTEGTQAAPSGAVPGQAAPAPRLFRMLGKYTVGSPGADKYISLTGKPLTGWTGGCFVVAKAFVSGLAKGIVQVEVTGALSKPKKNGEPGGNDWLASAVGEMAGSLAQATVEAVLFVLFAPGKVLRLLFPEPNDRAGYFWQKRNYLLSHSLF